MPSAKPARAGQNHSSRGKPRAHDPARIRKALIGQVEAVAEAAHRLTPEQRALPSGLPGWDVHHLLVHIALQTDAVPRLLAGPAVPAGASAQAGVLEWARASSHPPGVPAVPDGAPEAAGEAATTEDGAARLDEAVAQLEPVLESAVREDVLVSTRLGVMRMLDFTVTRLVELVVHSDDLARATGAPVTLDRQALAVTVRLLADLLAVRAPGGAVEVRVPPFAVVQCVEGPRHTRGTPPNVVETDPRTWLRLATGRTRWADAVAVGAVSASGERADLTGQLPVLG
ncbi:maleylpyruvate isomerase family mycothiol-dependent enzyme [Streptomyces sp. HNM0574]|uniref:maleylpyruvate isomerase family mycothiol-dependent enzyme n=1 Tax=Streptomyces sp. HNM0574 TaxID=2714954 RepID=UPI00146BDEE7|nr:maleylpyruvate isomerase family mycothiol-dependent enzyme [Streptomyces sp. HNM0574]NLU68500.1 maleylpyruvate isomerase family mycothiol-dependent enzyme [Streptomyces sp. HNM0574]